MFVHLHAIIVLKTTWNDQWFFFVSYFPRRRVPTNFIGRQFTSGTTWNYLGVHLPSSLHNSIMGPLQLSDHVVQNRQTGEQMTHWVMLNKGNSNLVAFFNMSQCVICSPVWRFCTMHVIAKLQRAYYKWKNVLVSKDSVIRLSNESIKVKLRP